MDFNQLISTITPEAYENLRKAVELGKWPNGTPLSPEQREYCLQAVIAYDAQHKQQEERVGHIPPKSHTHCGSDGKEDPLNNEPKPVKWK